MVDRVLNGKPILAWLSHILFFSVATFVEIIRAIESPWEVKDITLNYFGETKEAKNFANAFIEKRIAIKKQIEAEQKKKKEIEQVSKRENCTFSTFFDILHILG